jgi:hypothetical protein
MTEDQQQARAATVTTPTDREIHMSECSTRHET